MSAIQAYREQTPEWYRIDMLLAAYDGTIARIEQAMALVKNNEANAASPLLVRALRIILELYAGIDLRHGEIPENVQKLYIYTMHRISLGDDENLQSALDVLNSLREGLRSIREEAVELEQKGELHSVDHDVHQLTAVG